MEAKELMIGDWVCTDNCEAIKVRMVDDYGDVVLDWDDDRMSPVNNIKEIKPIPLTPEILEKNGFELKPDGWLWSKEGIEDENYIFIQFRRGSVEVRNCEINFIGKASANFKQIYYVNQLQHALKLCGIKKEIEL